MLPPPTAEYAGYGPLTLAMLTHEAEDSGDDIKFLAVQDAVGTLTWEEAEIYRLGYIDMMRRRGQRRDVL